MKEEKTSFQIAGRQFDNISVRGVDPLGAQIHAGQVTKRMRMIEKDYEIHDTAKIAMLAALMFAAEADAAQNQEKEVSAETQKSLEEMTLKLRLALKNEIV